MKRFFIYKSLFACLLSLLTALPLQAADDTAIEMRIEQLLSQMTTTEKVGQLALRDWGTYSRADMPAIKQAIRDGKIGGFLNVNSSEVDDNAFAELQRIAVEESPPVSHCCSART